MNKFVINFMTTIFMLLDNWVFRMDYWNNSVELKASSSRFLLINQRITWNLPIRSLFYQNIAVLAATILDVFSWNTFAPTAFKRWVHVKASVKFTLNMLPFINFKSQITGRET